MEPLSNGEVTRLGPVSRGKVKRKTKNSSLINLISVNEGFGT